jgi:hypothetical protein
LFIEPLNLPKLNLEVVDRENFTIFHSYFLIFVSFFYSIKGIVYFFKRQIWVISLFQNKKKF